MNGWPSPAEPLGRPRVLGVRLGVNPNSSSLGLDVTWLLFGGAGAMAIGIALSAWLRGRAAVSRLTKQAPDGNSSSVDSSAARERGGQP